jgi:MoaA/NifB/PqqE/SkfB family radical SAM enzyme
MCNDDYSTQWQKELEKIVGDYEPKVRNLKGDWLHPLYEKLGDIKFLYLAGGEPFIIPQTFQLLDIFHSKKNEITLFINTNLSNLFYKDVDILDVISKYKQTHLMISCDGFGEIGEYQRTGFKTERFKENLHKVIEKTKSSDIQIQIVHALTSLNIWNIFKFLDELKSEFGLDDSVVNIQNVQNPWYYSVSYGSSQYKKKVETFIKENYDNYSQRTKQQLGDFINFINQNNVKMTKEMKTYHYDYIKKIDLARGTNVSDVLPEWKSQFFKEFVS